MRRRTTAVVALIATALLFFAINILASAGLRQIQVDLTENRLFTLSQGSRNLLRDLRQDIRLRFFFSDSLATRLPQVKLYADRVRELLETYAAMSDGKIGLEVIDPEPFSDAEDRAVQAGIHALPIDSAGRSIYFGLVGTNAVDDQQVIAFFSSDREQFLEYDLTKLIYNLNTPKKPTVGVLGSLPLEFGPGGLAAAMRGDARPYAILNELRQVFQVKMLDADVSAIDGGIDVLAVVHPKDLAPAALYAIDQFVLRGGRAIVFADPFAETAAAMPDPTGGRGRGPFGDHTSNPARLLSAWGVSMKGDQFVADLGLAQRVQTGQTGPRQVVDYVAWLNVNSEHMNRDDVVTSELNSLNLASAGSLRPVEGAATGFVPLIWSSAQAMLASIDKVRGRPDPDALLAEFKPSEEQYAMAARITGMVKTAFPDGAPPSEKKSADGQAPAPPEHLAESTTPINVIVVADVDMLDDRFWLRQQDILGQRVAVPIANNGDFVLNSVDNLSGSGDLVSLRSRGRSQRPFEVVEAMRRDAEQKFLARERDLQKKLEETQKKIAELQGQRDGGGALLSSEERTAIEGFRDELVTTRKELREVQRALNQDIEWLEAKVKFVNIGLVPLGLGLIAASVGALRRRRTAHG